MATPAHQDLLGLDEQEAPRRTVPPPARTAPPHTASQPSMRPVRRAAAGSAGMRRVGLFLKILLGDMTIWAVLSGVLTYEVIRRGLDPQHALAGAAAGLLVAIAVSVGLKPAGNRGRRLHRRRREVRPGDPSEA